MTLTIGRCGLDVTHDEVQSLDDTSTNVRISGWLRASTLADAKVLRQQLLGHVNNPDEPVVPVTWSTDSTLDGFYKVNSASVGMQHEQRNIDNLIFPFSVDLERVDGTGMSALAECNQVVALRTNPHGITTASWLPLPWLQDVGIDSFIRNGTTSTYMSGTVPRTGDSTWMSSDSTPSIYPGTSFSQILLPASSWYTGGCRVEVGTSNRYAVGRQIVRDLTNWRISNGLVRVIANASAGAQIDVQWHNGSSWSSTKSFAVTLSGSSYTTYTPAPTSMHILRNSPERVTVRVVSAGTVFVDLSIRRGSRFVEVNATESTGINASAWGVKRTTTEASTALTGGIRATSNDGDSNRFVLSGAGSNAITTDLVNGRMYVSAGSPTSFQFGISSEIGGSGATGMNTAQNQVYQYMAVWGETMRVVSR
jgi:hypothetical protein